MRNKLLNILFCLLLTLLSAVPAYAGCDEDSAADKMKSDIASNLTSLKAAVTAYNSTVQKYQENTSCPAVQRKTPFKATKAEIAAIKEEHGGSAMQEFMASGKAFESTGIDWEAMSAGASSNCAALINSAKKQLETVRQYFYKARVGLELARNVEVNLSCACDEANGDQECVTKVDEAATEKGDTKGCLPLAAYMSDISNCPLCPIFQILLNTNIKLADIAWDALATAFQSVVVIFFSVLLALETLKAVASPAGASPGSYLKNVLTLGLKIAVTYILLSNSSYIYNYFISPTLKGALDTAMALLSIDNPGAMDCYKLPSGFSPTSGGKTLDASLMGSMYNAVQCFSQSAATMPAVGRALICHAWDDILPDLSMWFSGLIFYIFGLGIWLAFSFYLIDCTVQLGIVSALVPMLIACWPFKQTRRYSVTGVKLVMNTFFCYVMMGVVLVMSVKIMGHIAGNNQDSGMSDFINALNGNDIDKLKELASLDLQSAFVLIVCAILVFKLIGVSTNIAEKFSQSSGSDIGAKMGGAAASGATAIAKTAGKVGGKIAGTAAAATGVTAAIDKAQSAVGGAVMSGASKAGKAIGLGRFQPGAQKGANGTGTPAVGGKNADKSGNQPGNNSGNKQNSGNGPNQPNGRNSDSGSGTNPDNSNPQLTDNTQGGNNAGNPQGNPSSGADNQPTGGNNNNSGANPDSGNPQLTGNTTPKDKTLESFIKSNPATKDNNSGEKSRDDSNSQPKNNNPQNSKNTRGGG